jgi:hypothetical protein
MAALVRGASAAELPEPMAIIYPVLMFFAGAVLLGISRLLLIASVWKRR